MQEVIAFVDYDNVFSLNPGRDPTFVDHSVGLDRIVSALVELCSARMPSQYELRVRLYGGWHDRSTGRETEAREILGRIAWKHYPLRRRSYRLFVELADSLFLAPDVEFVDTVRDTPGFKRFQLQIQSDACPARRSDCPLEQLSYWRRGKCARHRSCFIGSRDAVSTRQQKLVDTSIVADMVGAAAADASRWVLGLSNDDDILAGALAASQFSKRVLHLRLGRNRPCVYDEPLSRAGVTIIDLPGSSIS